MTTEINEALHWINSRLKFGIKPGLERMKLMLESLGNPERRLKAIHVAGTNGKGSTVSFMRHILQEAGYVVGTFTSPFIETFNERISVNGEPISDDDFVEVFKKVKPIVEEIESTEYGAPTEFEILTVIAIEYFVNYAVPDITIMETGLGGRLDSTNVIHPLLSIITNIGHDHMDILGETIAEITKEKAGIIKSGVPVVSAVRQEEAIKIITDTVIENRSKLFLLGKDFLIKDVHVTDEKQIFTYQSLFTKKNNVEITMKGEHQIKNAAVALMAIDFLKQFYSIIVDDEHIRAGLLQTVWNGRFEKIADKPPIIVDGAHNPEGIGTLCKTINQYFVDKKVHIIFCAMKDKLLKEMISKLDIVADKLIFTQFDFPRCADAKDLFELSTSTNKHMEINWEQAIEKEKANLNEDGVLIVTGSLYFISVVRGKLV